MCGVFGVYAPGHDVARLTYFGLFALQHRGQESAGIAVSEAKTQSSLRRPITRGRKPCTSRKPMRRPSDNATIE